MPARAAARATARSPSWCIIEVKPVGARTSGRLLRLPTTTRLVHLAHVTQDQGRNSTRAKDSRARRADLLLAAPWSTRRPCALGDHRRSAIVAAAAASAGRAARGSIGRGRSSGPRGRRRRVLMAPHQPSTGTLGDAGVALRRQFTRQDDRDRRRRRRAEDRSREQPTAQPPTPDVGRRTRRLVARCPEGL